MVDPAIIAASLGFGGAGVLVGTLLGMSPLPPRNRLVKERDDLRRQLNVAEQRLRDKDHAQRERETGLKSDLDKAHANSAAWARSAMEARAELQKIESSISRVRSSLEAAYERPRGGKA